MSAMPTATSISVIPASVGSVVTLTFEFELAVTGGLDGRQRHDPIYLAQLFDAWSIWWSRFALDISQPDSRGRLRVIGTSIAPLPRQSASSEAGLTYLALAHPTDLASPGGGMEYLQDPRVSTWERGATFSFDESPSLDVLYPRRRRPSPDVGFAYALSAGSDRHVGETQLFCVGVPWDLWFRPNADRQVLPFDYVVFEVGFDGFYAWVGSGESKGSGWVKFLVGSMIFPLMMAVANEPIDQALARHDIQTELHSVQGTPCHVTGNVTLDLSELTQVAQSELLRNDRRGVCNLQAALHSLHFPPGPIDGVLGPQTMAALSAFKQAWKLEGVDTNMPVFAKTVVRALRGESPP